MDATFTLYGEIAEIVRRETRYLRHYWGEVLRVDDPKRKGRVLASVPELGWNTQATGVWCQSRDRHSMVVPEIGERVEVYFMGGDRDRPVYLGTAHEIGDQTPADYMPKTAVIWQDPKSGASITFNGITKIMTIDLGSGLQLVLKSGDATLWAPNVLPNCLFTGTPHGGTVAGIVKLKGA